MLCWQKEKKCNQYLTSKDTDTLWILIISLAFRVFAMVMKREIIENWKKNLYAFIGLYAAFALVVVGNMWGMSMNAENAFASPDIFFVRYCTNILGAFIFICLLGSFDLCFRHFR